MRPEVILAAGYCALLIVGALMLEWLSAHTHRRSLRYRTAGFTYDEQRDHWGVPRGPSLAARFRPRTPARVRYRAKPHVCNGCRLKSGCTDSDRGREIVRPLDPWHSEAGRFHRGLSLMLVGLALLILVIVSARHYRNEEAALLLAVLAAGAITARRLLRDFREHPANFPTPTSTHDLGMTITAADGHRTANLGVPNPRETLTVLCPAAPARRTQASSSSTERSAARWCWPGPF